MEKGSLITKEEYSRRLELLRARMSSQGLDSVLLLSPVSNCYMTGYRTTSLSNYQCLAIPIVGDPVILVWELELPGVFLSSCLKDAILFRTGEDRFMATRKMLKDRGLINGVIGIEKDAQHFSPADYENLVSVLDGCRIADCSSLVRTLQRIKSASEIDAIRKSARISEKAMLTALDAVSGAITDQEVAAAASSAIISAGSEFPCLSTVVTTGSRSGIPHTSHHRKVINPGDAIFIELGGCYERYTAPLMRTAFKGEPPADACSLADATVQTLNEVLDTIKPGLTGDDVAASSGSALPLNDSEIVFHHTYGYSVGLGMPPTWADDPDLTLIRGNHVPLESGMVFHSTISVRRNNKYGCGISETFLVTETGCETLTNFPREYLYV